MKKLQFLRLGSIFLCLLSALLWATDLRAENPVSPAEVGALDLAQLASVKIDIESINPRPVSEQPGIVTVILAQEIREMGARDLTDILQLVPGFGLGMDVNGVVGPSFRGLWAYEGKLQLIVDGVEMNETLYGTVQLGHHIPADAIAEVEIIRGPGSAKYGGTAELAVIRVTTKGASQNGGYAVSTISFADGRMAEDYTGGFGYTVKDWRVSANAFVSDSFRSNRKYTALDGTSFDLTHDSDINTRMVNVGLGWKDLDLRLIYDLYQLDDRINFGEPLAQTEPIEFETIAASATYNYRVNDWLTLSPNLTYRRQIPWYGGVPGSTSKDVTDRYISELTAVAKVSDAATLLWGVRYDRDSALAEDTSFYGVLPANFYNNGTSDNVAYDTYSTYGQFDWDLKWVNLTVGGRYENQSAVGGETVPRVALTKAWDRFHLKLLYDQAYRTPNINVINSPQNDPVQPENTTSYQLEAGYTFKHGFSLTENVYYLQIENPIVYTVDPGTLDEGYVNGSKISTYGTEMELRYSQPKFSATLGYSLYVVDQNSVATWQSGDSLVTLGIPAHKFSASATWHILDRLSWNWNGTFTTGQRAYTYGNDSPVELNSTLLVNSFLEYRWKNASLGLGLANLLDQNQAIAQPYNGGEAPLILTGREIFLKFGLRF